MVSSTLLEVVDYFFYSVPSSKLIILNTNSNFPRVLQTALVQARLTSCLCKLLLMYLICFENGDKRDEMGDK